MSNDLSDKSRLQGKRIGSTPGTQMTHTWQAYYVLVVWTFTSIKLLIINTN